jgi:hypothetical protein
MVVIRFARLKLYAFLIFNFGFIIFIVNHQIVFDAVDKLIMPDGGQLCKMVPLELSEFWVKNLNLLLRKDSMSSFPNQQLKKWTNLR